MGAAVLTLTLTLPLPLPPTLTLTLTPTLTLTLTLTLTRWGPRPSQLEACPPPTGAITGDGWKTAGDCLAHSPDAVTSLDPQKAAAAEGAAAGGLPLLRMLLQLAADVELGGGSSAPEVLRDAS